MLDNKASSSPTQWTGPIVFGPCFPLTGHTFCSPNQPNRLNGSRAIYFLVAPTAIFAMKGNFSRPKGDMHLHTQPGEG